MDADKKRARYTRIIGQIKELFLVTRNPIARMSTVNALLFNKFEYFFWCGFYLLDEGVLTVGPYQGSLACQVLETGKGVCWAGIIKEETIVVEDVHDFPGHIACDSRSNSEIVVPLKDATGKIIGVLDVDSKNYKSFSKEDAEGLEIICQMIYS